MDCDDINNIFDNMFDKDNIDRYVFDKLISYNYLAYENNINIDTVNSKLKLEAEYNLNKVYKNNKRFQLLKKILIGDITLNEYDPHEMYDFDIENIFGIISPDKDTRVLFGTYLQDKYNDNTMIQNIINFENRINKDYNISIFTIDNSSNSSNISINMRMADVDIVSALDLAKIINSDFMYNIIRDIIRLHILYKVSIDTY